MSGAVVNVVLNLMLIPSMGAQGAAVATAVSYFAVFVIRAVNARKYVPFSLSLPMMIAGVGVLVAQSIATLVFDDYFWLYVLFLRDAAMTGCLKRQWRIQKPARRKPR